MLMDNDAGIAPTDRAIKGSVDLAFRAEAYHNRPSR
jgi:hypothetical protein